MWWFVPARLALDLGWAVPAGPVSLPQLGSGLLALVALAVVLRDPRRAAAHPWRWPMGAFAAAVVVGAARADAPFDAARYGSLLLVPALGSLALAARPVDQLPRSWWVSAAVVVVASLGYLAAGQPAAHVVNGWPRLLGPYGNLHTAASVFAVVAATAVPWAACTRDRWVGALGLAAVVCLAATWVRAGWLWVGLAWVAVALVRRQYAVAAALVAVALAGGLGIGAVRERWSDVGALATGVAPDGGWGALGSWRGRIWTESIAAYLAGPPADVWLGRGLGGQFGLHRHLDPHSDWLSLLAQLGPLGLSAWLWWMGRALVDLYRGRHRVLDAVAFGVLAANVAVAAIGNDGPTRLTATGWTIWLATIAVTSRTAPPPSPPPGSAPASPGSGPAG